MLRLVRTMILGLGCACVLATAAAQAPPTKKYGFCMAQGVQSKPYMSKTFETPWPVTTSLESRYLTFIKSKYGVTASRPYCYTYATLADAQRYRPEIVRDEAAWISVDWTPTATAPAPASTTPKPQPVAPATTAAAQQGASQPYFRCEVTGRIANFVATAGDLRQGIPPKLGDNQCAAPGASCQWANGVLTLREQIDGKPQVRILDTLKATYTTHYNGQEIVSPCTKKTN